jgi:hypothetical protein
MVLMERDLSLGKNVATRLHAREIDTGRGRWTIQMSNSDAEKYCRPRVRALGLSGNSKVLAITIHLGRDADRQVVRLQDEFPFIKAPLKENPQHWLDSVVCQSAKMELRTKLITLDS